MRTPVQIALGSGLISFVMVLLTIWSVEWGGVIVRFRSFDRHPRVMDFSVGLVEADLRVTAPPNMKIMEERHTFRSLERSFRHLPVVRQYKEFETAGWIAFCLLGAAQVSFLLLCLSLVRKILNVQTSSKAPFVLGLIQGVCLVVGSLSWVMLIPVVGAGLTYKIQFGWASQAMLSTAGIHLIVTSTASLWAYRMYSQEHHFSRLPSSEVDVDLDTAGPESATSMELTIPGNPTSEKWPFDRNDY